MLVHSIPATSDAENDLFASAVLFDGLTPKKKGDPKDYRTAVSETVGGSEERMPVAVIDLKGLLRHNINDVLLKRLKIRGARTWFLTNIECVDDVFDAFNTDAEKVLMPTHTLRSMAETEDILSVSDSAVPALFVRDGRALFLGKYYGADELVEIFADIGFPAAAVIDIDGSVGKDMWKDMSSSAEIIGCSFTGKMDEAAFSEAGIDTVLTIPS